MFEKGTFEQYHFMANEKMITSCCICGGGPAGIMLGFLLARAGIDVIVLEKHADFFRDFRGDTIHPSTIQLMHELGLLDAFLQVPHQEVAQLSGYFNGVDVQIGDFTHLKVAKPILALMPQWDFLNFISQQAAKYPGFTLLQEAKVYELIKEGSRVTGIKADTPDGTIEIKADLIVGADGRSSDVRKLAGLKVINTGAPIDVLWFRLSKNPATDPKQTLGRFEGNRMMVLLNRGDYWQCAYVIMKGELETIQGRGIDGFRKDVIAISPFFKDRVTELKDWNDIKLLNVVIDHLEKWYAEGVLCIGDASHAMSPVGGVGINLAIQDAVAAANILYPHLLKKERITIDVLRKIQQRRAFPARMIQRMQVIIQNGIVRRKQTADTKQSIPFFLKLFKMFPFLTRMPAKIIGMGIRPEHIKTPDTIPQK
jgi:2-polyprenyl-6-methoxyphenol hydroxylase-like FAD-dependent oxidoreductase